MDPNTPTGGPPPGWVPPPPGDPAPNPGWPPAGPPPGPPPGLPTGPPAWSSPQPAWGAPNPAWAPQPKRKRFGWVAVIVAFLIGGFVSAIVTIVAMVAIALAFGMPDSIAGTHAAIREGADPVTVGDCLDDRPSIAVVEDQTDVVDCNEAHDAEVMAIIEVPGGDHKPGEDDLQAYVDDACSLAFWGYVGSDPITSQYSYAAVVPDDDAWRSGDRTVFCLVDTVNTPSGSGSVKGSGD